jgi:hypothetical protein
MNKIIKIILTFACILGAAISGLYILEGYKYRIGEVWAPIYINIEIDKNEAHNVAIFLTQQQETHWPSPTTDYKTNSGNIIMSKNIQTHGFYRGLALCFPNKKAEDAINAIDNISVFIGNKLFYFTQSDIKKWPLSNEGELALVKFPNIQYSPSFFIKNWTNYYGDFNLFLRGVCNFLFYPARFAPTYFFLLCLLFIYRKKLQSLYKKIRDNKKITEYILLTLLVLFAFALRFNGYTRHSGWSDEIYSATHAGNPTLPFISTFADSGNPPFYFLLLKVWFKIFGWTEAAGTMLSVIIGTLAVPFLYFFVRPFFGKKIAFIAAFFLCVCAFAIGYSQEMRSYILKMCLSPIIAIVFFSILKKITFKNCLAYIVLGVCIVNTHYYGILFIIANFIFYVVHNLMNDSKKEFALYKTINFFICNAIIALSFIPYFLYQMLVKQYYFDRVEIHINAVFTGLLLVIAIFSFAALYLKKWILSKNFFQNKIQIIFSAYIVFIPCLIYALAYVISLVKPMIAFRYLMPINLPFMLCVCAVFVYLCAGHPKIKYFCIFIVWAFALGLYETTHDGGIASIPGNGTESYKEARAFIAADSAAHPQKKSAMLDNAPEVAKYYDYDDMPHWTKEGGFDVMYVFNDIFYMHEYDMYDTLANHGFDDKILKIRINDDTFVFKKYF